MTISDRARVRPRTPPNLADKLCCMILLHYGIPHNVGKMIRREDILRLVEWDHYPVAYATARDLGWSADQYNHPSNLQPILTDPHALKTATEDIPQIAKDNRISDAHAEHRRRMLAKAGGEDGAERDATAKPRPTRWSGRKMQSRPFPKREKV